MGKYSVGDTIKFNFFGQIIQGKIETVGKFGYWIKSTTGCVGSGSKRCPFDKATLINTEGM